LEPDEKKFALFSTCVFYVVQRFLCFWLSQLVLYSLSWSLASESSNTF
jgi:hypothetical protein